MSNRKILIFSLTYLPLVGGAELAVKEITDRIRDIDFDMVTMRFDNSHPRFEAVGNVHIHRVGWGSKYLHKILFVPLAAWKAWQLHRKNHYSKFWAIMTNMTFPIALMRLFGNRTPYILTLQDGDPFEYVFKRLRIRVFSSLLRLGFRQAAVVQPISNFLAGWARRLGYEGRIEIIPNGVDIERFKALSGGANRPGEIVLITTSRLVKKNGIGDVIEAMKLLPENIRFKVLGSGELETGLKSKAKSLGRRVEFLGYVSHTDLPKHLQEADIFVRPSLSEGMGSSFVEAMAAGLPIIATPVGGIPDFLFDPDKDRHKPPTGLFVNVEDPRDIARQVSRLAKDKRLRETLVVNGLRLVRERYDWDLIAGQMKSKVFN